MIARTLLALCLVLALPASAVAAPPAIGIGEQKASMFDDARWQRLGLRDVRYIAPWDALRDPRQRERLDEWVAAARAGGSRILIGFERSLRSQRLARTLPPAWKFEREFIRFRERYPFVRDWIAWNEANHPFSLTARRPRRAAQYFDAIAWNCRRCRIVAADVLDVRGMTSWVRRFQAHAVHTPRIWGLHNYVDANRFKSDGTEALLRVTKGRVWLTETGGLIVRREYAKGVITREFRYSRRHAARATAHALRLGCLSRRIRRVYLYHWRAPETVTNWDSAFVSPRGKVRPAYRTLKRRARRRLPLPVGGRRATLASARDTWQGHGVSAATESPPARAERRERNALAAAALTNGPGELIDFLLPLWAGLVLDATATEVGILLALELAVSLVARPLAGVLADTRERRTVAAVGALLYAAACVGYAAAGSLAAACVAAAVGGAGGALLWVALRALVSERLAVDDAVFPRLMSARETGSWVAFVGGLTLLVVIDFTGLFLVCAAACAVGAGYLLASPPRAADPRDTAGADAAGIGLGASGAGCGRC